MRKNRFQPQITTLWFLKPFKIGVSNDGTGQKGIGEFKSSLNSV